MAQIILGAPWVAQILGKYNLSLTRLSETPSVSGSALVGLIEKVGV
jgi:hypothetical protein